MTRRVPRLITTPIYYVNDRPHMGHAYATVQADVMARYMRAAGHDVFFLTGADEHGEKIARAAAQAGQSEQAFVERHARAFRDAWATLNVAPDHFVRTTDTQHIGAVQQVLERLHQAGEIYLAEYRGLYSIGQERFVTEKELVDGKLPEDKDPPVERVEANYFFRMEKHRAWMRELLTNEPDLVQPSHYRNEILQILEEPIGDLSISRPAARLSWGIPIPWDPAHVTYVWFDALLSYVSPLGFPDGEAFTRRWPHASHVIGKDILRTHTLFWLSMLRAMNVPPYHRLFVSGHLLGTDGRKMSKSLGNGVDPLEAASKYGADVLRYALVREVSFGFDGIISDAIIEQRLARDLADDLGNLAARTLAMIRRYRHGVTPAPDAQQLRDVPFATRLDALPDIVIALVEDLRLAPAVERIMEEVRALNRHVASEAPWALAKAEQTGDNQMASATRLDTVLYTVVESLRAISDLLAPVMPVKMRELRTMLGIDPEPGWAIPWGQGVPSGSCVSEGILFPKYLGAIPAE